jgi:chromosomal replication initiation ATPase DnaA
MMLPDHLQLLLPFPYVPGYDSLDFLPDDSNQDALAWLDTGWPDQRLALWGPPGCGKSHLLHIWAERAGAPLLTGHMLRDLDSLPGNGALALDDADAIAPEPLLLHLLNTARDRGLRLLLAARAPPSRWPVRLPDLSSRLRAITTVEIAPPSDALLAALLIRLAADRQLSVPKPVQDWILTRLPRSAASLRQAVAWLDQASLALRKPITLSLAASVLPPGAFAVADDGEVSMSHIDHSTQSPGFL